MLKCACLIAYLILIANINVIIVIVAIKIKIAVQHLKEEIKDLADYFENFVILLQCIKKQSDTLPAMLLHEYKIYQLTLLCRPSSYRPYNVLHSFNVVS